LNFDSNTFVIDATNNRVGVGTASPATTIEASVDSSSGNGAVLRLSNRSSAVSSGVSSGEIEFYKGDLSGGAGVVSFIKSIPTDLGANYDVTFGTGSSTSVSERMRITSAGNVGIGTSSPGNQLEVGGEGVLRLRPSTDNTQSSLYLNATTTGGSSYRADIQIPSTGGIVFETTGTLNTAPTERMRIDSSGNVGIGTSTVNAKLEIASNNNSGTALNVLRFTDTDTAINSGQQIGSIEFYTADLTNVGVASKIMAVSEGSSGVLGLTFSTGSSATIAERMRLDSSGNLGLGVTPSVWDATGMKTINMPYGYIVSQLANQITFGNNAYFEGVAYKYQSSNPSSQLRIDNTGGFIFRTAPSGTAGNAITFTQAMTLDGSGNLGVGTTSSLKYVTSAGSTATNYQFTARDTRSMAANVGGGIAFEGNDGGISDRAFGAIIGAKENATSGNYASYLSFLTRANGSAPVERMRIDSSGNLLVAKTTGNTISSVGVELQADGEIWGTGDARAALSINRLTNDGQLVIFYQDNTAEGSISVSGTTVSYNGGHLSRYAQTLTAKDESILKGTVLSNLDEMNTYVDADGNPVENEQLNKVKVSDTEGDVNVAGVFVNWYFDEQHNVDEINMAMTGDMIIRIAQGVTVQRGDLLMSAGNGTAKQQGDDIVRSKTIAKVTSTNITCTYTDGSYCVPCVLMAC
jgi:hypothetical protein